MPSNKLQLSKYLVFLSVLTAVSAFFILVNNSYNSVVQTRQKILDPIKSNISNSSLDTDFVNNLQQKNFFSAPDIKFLPTPNPTQPLPRPTGAPL